MRSGLRRLLNDESDLSVVAEAGRIEQVLATIRLSKVDVILMDMNLPGMDSVESTRRLLRVNEELRIVVLGPHESGPYPVHLFKAGIAGYLTKASSGEEMLVCIRKVARGQRHVSADVAQTLLLDHMQDGNSPLGCLTQRELSVLVLLSVPLQLVTCQPWSGVAVRVMASPEWYSRAEHPVELVGDAVGSPPVPVWETLSA